MKKAVLYTLLSTLSIYSCGIKAPCLVPQGTKPDLQYKSNLEKVVAESDSLKTEYSK